MEVHERCKALRALLKERGWSNRAVGVKAETYSGGSSIEVFVKRQDISLDEVRALARRFEEIRRDAWGEILGGCNIFVHVRRSRNDDNS